MQESHYWRFEASGTVTRFVHGEDYKGWLAFLFWECVADCVVESEGGLIGI